MEIENIPKPETPPLELILDTSNPFIKVCPYCGEKFTASHKARLYCPEKYGLANFCKAKMKELDIHRQLVASSIPDIQVYKPPLPVPEPPIVTTVQTSEPAMIEMEAKLDPIIRQQTIERIELLLDGCKYKEFSPEEFDNVGLDINAYDRRIKLPRSNKYRTEIGNYSLLWTHAKKILIIHQSEILWISQP